MYREAAQRDDERSGEPPRTYLYRAIDRSTHNNSAVVMFKLFTGPMLIGLVIGGLTSSTVGLVVGVVAFVGAVYWFRSARAGSVSVLSVDDGSLEVSRRKKVIARFTLKELRDVALDIKTIQRVQEGASLVPATRFIDTRVGPEIDTARIVLVAKKKRFLLSEDYLAHVDATEELGKIRTFLRKNGWVPKDERVKPGGE